MNLCPEQKLGKCASAMHFERDENIIWVKGRVVDNRLHKHHALQIAWAMPGTELRLQTHQEEIRGQAVLVNGGVMHSLSMERGVIALLDSGSSLAGWLRQRLLGERTAAKFEGPTGAGSVLNKLRSSTPPWKERAEWIENRDERVVRVLEWLDELEATRRWNMVSLEDALAITHLSRSRFLHLFAEQVGSPWRTYLLWRRALVAITLAIYGLNLTNAAYSAGYSDSAHFSRQFAALFGVTPSAVIKNSHFVQS